MKQNRVKQLVAAAAFSAVLLAGGAPAMAAQQVQVTLPTFDVTLNGTTVDNSSRRYPLLVYKDITYVPMTYYDCRFLGLETIWNQQDGLGIIKNDLSGAYYEDTIAKKNAKRDKAQIATGAIAVNGKQINNAKEQYPLLLYRDVTYFPLTWRFAVDEFGWQYQFSHANGLVISADNQKTDSLFITDGRTTAEGLVEFDFIINSENMYYQGKDGVIYQRPLNQWQDNNKRTAVAQIPEDSYADGYRHVWFSEVQDEVYYEFWYGGATMGGSSKYRIGTAQAAYQQSKDSHVDFGDFTIRIAGVQIGGPSAAPLTYIDNKDGRTRALGEADYYYVDQNSYHAKSNVLYAKVSDYNASTGTTSHASLYKVNVADGTMELYMDVCPDQYAVAGDMLYYWYYTDKVLYAKDLNTGKETVAAAQVNQDIPFAGTANGVYFSSTEAGKQLCYWDKASGKITVRNDKGRLMALEKSNGYAIARFEETADNPHRLLVFDPQGRQVYASADVAYKAVVNKNGVLVYQLATMNQLVQVQLNTNGQTVSVSKPVTKPVNQQNNQPAASTATKEQYQESVELNDMLHYNNFTIDNDYLYYQGDKAELGKIFRRPLTALADDTQRTAIVDLPYDADALVDMHYPGYYVAKLYTQAGKLNMAYDGRHYYNMRVKAYTYHDVSGTEAFYDFGGFQLFTEHTDGGDGNRLIKSAPAKKVIGAANVEYQVNAEDTLPYNANDDLLYVMGRPLDEPNDTEDGYYLYEIDLSKNTARNVLDEKISGYAYENGIVYIWQNVIELYAVDLQTGDKEYIATLPGMGKRCTTADNGVYLYIKNYNQDNQDGVLQYWNKATGEISTINGQRQVNHVTNQNGYIAALFTQGEGGSGMLVFDKAGKQVYACADMVDHAVINQNGVLVYQLQDSKQLVKVQL